MTTTSPQARFGPLIDFLGRSWTVDSPVVATAFNGSTSVAAFVLGNGHLALARCDGDDIPGGQPRVNDQGALEVTSGDRPAGPLTRVLASAHPDVALVPDIRDGFLGGDRDGALLLIEPDGGISELARFANQPVTSVAASRQGGLRACAVGQEVHLHGPEAGKALATFRLDQPAAALAFDPKGRRLAAAHEGGLTLWPTGRTEAPPKTLPRAGGHVAVAWSPDDRFVASGTTDKALHVWRLRDGADFDLPGLAAPPRGLAWARKSRFVVSDGGTQVVCWSIVGQGRKGHLRSETLGIPSEILVTCVTCHPLNDTIAVGYANGAVLLCGYGRAGEVFVKGPGEGAVKSVAWSDDGRHLALGTEEGFAAIVSFPAGYFK